MRHLDSMFHTVSAGRIPGLWSRFRGGNDSARSLHLCSCCWGSRVVTNFESYQELRWWNWPLSLTS